MKLPDETQSLLDAFLAGCATPEQEAELDRRLPADAELRAAFCDAVETDVLLSTWAASRQEENAAEAVLREMGSESSPGGSEVSGTELAAGDLSESTLARRASEGISPSPRRSASEEHPGLRLAGGSAPVPATRPHSAFRISRLALAAAVVLAIGLLAYTLWPRPAQQAVSKQIPAARIVHLTDAKWAGVTSQAGDTLITGQQLLLLSGSVEITFNSQARVIVEGPAQLTIVDATACRLADGKLVARVPDPAKGFKVHTPDGTVTDLGTEFGVYVDARADQQVSREEEQQPGGGPQLDIKLPPITEVHVFRGQVELAQAPGPPQSQIPNPKSQIISAGQAVTISDNKIQPLPAADPFKFALDKLQGKPRTVLLSEDFESYPAATAATAIGPWIVQTSTRKGQGVRVDDLAGEIDKGNAQADDQSRLPTPPPSIGKRAAILLSAAQNPKDTYPLLAREIDGRPLAGTCQVLFELEIQPVTPEVQPSFALAAEAGHAPGIELWRNADAAAQPILWSRGQCYRLRVLLSVVDGKPREARVERLAWRGAEGWVPDASYATPVPPLDWKSPPHYAIVGFPTVSPATPASIFWIDNVRVEVIPEK